MFSDYIWADDAEQIKHFHVMDFISADDERLTWSRRSDTSGNDSITQNPQLVTPKKDRFV